MNCPACREPMVVLELDEVEIDHCLSCGGIWLDGGELELLLGNSAEKNKLLASFQAVQNTKEKVRNCPICSKRMDKVLYGGGDKQVCIDKCRHNDGLWFDLGELEEITKMGNFDKNDKVLQLLRDVFKKS